MRAGTNEIAAVPFNPPGKLDTSIYAGEYFGDGRGEPHLV
jgi:hypothetical protein